MHDEDNNYKGVNEWAVDLKPIVDYYLQATGQKLVADPNSQVDATSGASKQPAKPEVKVDATTSASKEN